MFLERAEERRKRGGHQDRPGREEGGVGGGVDEKRGKRKGKEWGGRGIGQLLYKKISKKEN